MAINILVYKIAFSMETPIYVVANGIYKCKTVAKRVALEKNTEVHKRVNIGTPNELKKKLNDQMRQIFEDIGSHKYEMYLTDTSTKSNFRDQIATIQGYKQNRLNTPKPVHYRRMRELLIKEWDAVLVEGQEADDRLATRQTEINEFRCDVDGSIIASIDKDMLQVPGWHYNINNHQIDLITEQQGFNNLFKQVLEGDVADNIPGLVKICKLNNKEEEGKHLSTHAYIKTYEKSTIDYTPLQCYNYVMDMYKQLGFQDKFEEIFNLVWLRRYNGQNGFYDFKKEFLNDK